MVNTHIVTAIIDIIALLILFGLLRDNSVLANHHKKPFVYAISLAILIIIAETGTILSIDGSISMRGLHIVFNMLGFGLTPFIPIVLISIFDIKILKTQIILLLPSLLNLIISILSPFFGLYFYIDENNKYERGNMFFVFVIIYIVNLLLLFVLTILTGRKHLYSIKRKITSVLVFTLIGTCVQLFFPSIYSSWHCITLSLIMFYILLSEFDGSFDSLTGLYNRLAFEKTIKTLRQKKFFSVIVMDINNFKEINDTYGHDYGDSVLKKVADIIRNSFDSQCNCYRIGGDEFYVICYCVDHIKIESQLKNMTDSLTKERLNDNCLPTIAYGFETYDGHTIIDFQSMLKSADNQMYQFKSLQKTKIFKSHF